MRMTRRSFAMPFGVFLVAGLSAKVLWGQVAVPGYGFGGGAAFGNIFLESKDPKGAYDQAIKVCQEMGATISSYNSMRIPPVMTVGLVVQAGRGARTQIFAQIQVAKDKAAELMSRLASLGEVKNQSLSSRNVPQNMDQVKKQLEDLDKELKMIMGNRFPIIVSYAFQQRQALQMQVQQAESIPAQNFATISLTITEPVPDQPAPGKTCPLIGSPYMPAAIALVLGLAIGFFFAKRKASQ